MIKNLGGVFGRNPTFNNVEVEGDLTVDGSIIGTVVAGGSNTQVQFNNAGVLDANAGLTYDSATETLRVRSHPTRYLTIGPDGAGASAISAYGNRALALNSSDYNVEISATNGSVSIDSPEVTITSNMGVGGVITGTNTTASTSSTTGAVILSGGVGIAKDSFINGHRIGRGLLQDTTNLAVGANALQATIADGTLNTAIGSGCGSAITSGNKNTLFGYAVGTLVTTGAGNCSIGYSSLKENTVGNYNTAMGYGALQNTTADFNTAVGLDALFYITTGALNTAIGRQAGCFQADGTTALTTANNSVYLGRDTRGTQTDSNSVVIGYRAIGLGANTTVIGTSSTTANRIFGVNSTGQVAPTIASAATIAPTKQITFISGTTAINTITAPTGIATTGGQITIIPTGIFTTTTAGNIALASTAVVSRALIMTYDATTAKWYPSY